MGWQATAAAVAVAHRGVYLGVAGGAVFADRGCGVASPAAPREPLLLLRLTCGWPPACPRRALRLRAAR